MIRKIKSSDISFSSADAIVNASNGIGYMGGKSGIKKKKRGVAESIHYASSGAVEILAKSECKKKGIFGYASGEVFITETPNLNTTCIIHAVTMRFPGSVAKLSTVKKLAYIILQIAEFNDFTTVAIPLLGTGTGHLNKDDVLNIYDNYFKNSKVIFEVYC